MAALPKAAGDGGAPAAPLVRLVVVAYNSGGDLRRCLDCLLAQSVTALEIVVIDNASTDGAVEALEIADARVTLVRLPANLGFAAANNRAVEDARTPFVALVNPDAFAEPDWLARMLAGAERHPWADMFASVQLKADDPSRLDGLGDCYFAGGVAWRGGFGQPFEPPAADRRVFAPCGAAALFRTTRFRAAGGFDERYFCLLEDVDLAFRLRLLGGDCVLVADALVRHTGSATIGENSDFSLYHLARNQSWVFLKNMPLPLLVPLLPVHLALVALQLASSLRRRRCRPVARG
ncbi:MAG: glycosyltransferase family 2 protein, partial [Tistlia sp.]